MKKFLLTGAALVALAACETTTTETPKAPADIQVTAAVRERVVETTSPDFWGDWGIDLGANSASVSPGDDFFMYVNGGWFEDFEIPADRTSYGAFVLLLEKSEQQVKFIIEDLAASEPPVNTPAGKVAAYYNAYTDVDAINAAGLAPARPYLDRIAAISTREDLAELFGTAGYESPFSGFVWTDAKDPTTYIFQTSIGGLGLPDRDYYTNADEKSVELRGQYVSLIETMLSRAGYENAADMSRRVMSLESQIARADWDRAVSRNPEITYNKLSMEQFRALTGDFPIQKMADTLGIGDIDELLVSEVPPTQAELDAANISDEDAAKLGAGYGAVARLANTVDLETWKAYLTAHFLMDHSSVLPSDIDDAVFAFYGTALRGQPEQRPRWKRGVSAVGGALGEAIGATYVERHFPPENKAAMDELVANLSKAMEVNLENLEWMGEETKVLAFDKLEKFNPKVGYPDEFEDYASMQIGESALDNMIASSKFGLAQSIDRLGKDVDKSEWFMTPQTVNAYYNPAFNEIVFPAAILQPPFFNISADPAVNYGAIGAVIGHEMAHGFDDQGSKFNGDGVLSDWWTEADREAFRARTDVLVEQYNQFCPLGEDQDCVNGRLSLGENIADLAGVSLAYRAYRMSLNGEEAPVIDGLTGDQRFFMSWGQVWRSKYRDEAVRTQIRVGPHSPPLYRVNGIVRNIDEWYSAFDVQPGDELYLPPEERVRIW